MLKKFVIDIEPEALDDIQNAIDYYKSCKTSLGKRFYSTIDKHFNFLAIITLRSLSVMMISVACLWRNSHT